MTLTRAVLMLAVCVPAVAYNPPVDTAGPLTVRIETPALGSYGAGGLAEFNRVDTSVTVSVTVENASGAELQGSVRMHGIDKWKAVPAEAVPVSIAPHALERIDLQVSFGVGTYNADYPLHAYAEFLGGAPQISEAGHDRLVGYLDGSQAQLLRVDTTPGRQFV